MEHNSTNDGGPAMNLQAAVGEINHLKAKMTAMDANFYPAPSRMPPYGWYMNLPRNSIASYTDFHKKFIHQFAGSKHVQVTMISLFGIRQGHNENLREYLTRFNEATIQVSNPNQEMFVVAVQNGLKAGHFNESLAQKPASTMQEIMKRSECYIKGEESNAEKRSRDSREKPSSRRSPERYHRRNNQRSGRYKDEGSGRYHQPWRSNERTYRTPEEYTHNARMGANENAWCHYHRAKGHDTEKCYRLKDLIEKLISSGHLRKFLERAAKGDLNKRLTPVLQEGGGESIAARKRYLRRIIQETNMVAHISSPRAPEISFSPSDGEGVFPHNDEPLEAFKAMQLAGEQLQPYNGTLVAFRGEQVEVMGHVTLLTTFGEKENAKTIKVRYLVVKTAFTSYNIIIGRPTFNTLGAVMSTLYLSMKYLLDDGRIGTVRGDQAQGRQCYELNLDPREEFQDRRVSPIEDLEPIQIGEAPHELINLGTHLDEGEKEKIIEILRKNVDLFAWKPSDMLGIDESTITHNWSKHQTTARSHGRPIFK
ncbi:hypothetical protein TSUD_259350 [Trifolium subterraneum]|uniref:Retrotransposon gag domain-containing protein n=1 Tax=Trifolium subterraneum TaxID=3900 RepID=A0A2Z6NG40_TRISU|nr:hypothetical protein TSUD_259350 [Trifolium subterraneum]